MQLSAIIGRIHGLRHEGDHREKTAMLRSLSGRGIVRPDRLAHERGVV